jgi:hypothetical protein
MKQSKSSKLSLSSNDKKRDYKWGGILTTVDSK